MAEIDWERGKGLVVSIVACGCWKFNLGWKNPPPSLLTGSGSGSGSGKGKEKEGSGEAKLEGSASGDLKDEGSARGVL